MRVADKISDDWFGNYKLFQNFQNTHPLLLESPVLTIDISIALLFPINAVSTWGALNTGGGICGLNWDVGRDGLNTGGGRGGLNTGGGRGGIN